MNSGPVVKLIDCTRMPFDTSIASARTCYSSRGIVRPEDVSATPEARALRDRIAASTLKAGHLTTRQHPQFIFTLEKVSRQLVWSFLHSHPYYNSEQVSQRYVAVQPDSYYFPPALQRKTALADHFRSSINWSMSAYQELCQKLIPEARREFYQIFPARRKQPERWQGAIKKKAMEVARYVLPLATHTYLYHTINGLTLHRYRRLSRAFDVPAETQDLVEAMLAEVRRVDPDYAAEIADPESPEDTLEYSFFQEHYAAANLLNPASAQFVQEFDASLGSLSSILVSYETRAEAVLAASARAVMGQPAQALSDQEAIRLVLSPQANNYLQSTLNESSVSKISRSLYNVHYTFQKKISHTADSQDQRHRMVPGARPVLMSHFTGQPDFITPALVSASAELLDMYGRMHAKIFQNCNEFLEMGGTAEEASYLLPNSFPVRFLESGDLLNLHHKWKTRTCYNAQEEIFKASVEELEQVGRVHPAIARWIKAPCWVRREAGVTPFCPEGDRYCGVPVWNKELSDYRRVI
jgi:thymidylate synthase ThyX